MSPHSTYPRDRSYASDAYDSDNSTLVNSRSSRRRPAHDAYTRPRHKRRHSSPVSRSRQADEKSGDSGYSKFGKLALGVVFVELVATCFSVWLKKRDQELERQRRREQKRHFEKAKARRRRDESRWEREQEERDRMEMEEDRSWDDREIPRARRIELVGERDRSPSRSRRLRRIEAPPRLDDQIDERETSDQNDKGRSRSRPAFDRP